MSNTKSFNKKSIARSFLYIIYSGGLLTFCAIILEHICNNNCYGYFKVPDLNFLESAGIVSFSYIFLFGVINLINPRLFLPNGQKTNSHNPANISQVVEQTNSKTKNISTLNPQDKDRLRKIIAKKYGFEER
jgi:hypothetical protein